MKLKIYDPPMCCPTGVCGPSFDPELLRVQDMLITLGKKGVQVERYNIARQLAKFMLNPVISALLKEHGRSILPIIMVGDQVIKTGEYPSLEEICSIMGIAAE